MQNINLVRKLLENDVLKLRILPNEIGAELPDIAKTHLTGGRVKL